MIKLQNWWKGLLLYTWFIVVWGAFVRASGSGDGCGKNWPTCNGELFPSNSSIQTYIEYIHRATSGLYGIFVALLVFITIRVLLKAHKNSPVPNIKLALTLPVLVLLLTVFEALIGAQLVLSGLVGSNDSWARAIVMIIHLLNTFVLVTSIVGTHYALEYKTHKPSINFKKSLFLLSTLFLVAVAALGALTALGDTLYPANSLKEGIYQDLSQDAPWLLRLRVLHPVLAVFTVFLITNLCQNLLKTNSVRMYLVVTYLTLIIGVINLLLLAPIYMQLIHLLTAQALWSIHSYLGFQLFTPKVK